MKIFRIIILVLVVGLAMKISLGKTKGQTHSRIGPPNYLNFTHESFDSLAGNTRAICFMSDWNVYDEKVDLEIRSSDKRIPQDVVIFRADFDTEYELKKKYSIDIKHECLIFDKQGSITKRVNPEKILSTLSLQ